MNLLHASSPSFSDLGQKEGKEKEKEKDKR